MRLAILFSLLAFPAFAWKFSGSPVCTLTHGTEKADLAVTYDSRSDGPYAIEITSKVEAWERSPMFVMRFDGPQPNVIATDRHMLNADGKSLRVTDRGFGNVLDGIESNFIVTAKSGKTALIFQLPGAAPEVRRFRACVASPEI